MVAPNLATCSGCHGPNSAWIVEIDAFGYRAQCRDCDERVEQILAILRDAAITATCLSSICRGRTPGQTPAPPPAGSTLRCSRSANRWSAATATPTSRRSALAERGRGSAAAGPRANGPSANRAGEAAASWPKSSAPITLLAACFSYRSSRPQSRIGLLGRLSPEFGSLAHAISLDGLSPLCGNGRKLPPEDCLC